MPAKKSPTKKNSYVHLREDFFKRHPMVRVLLGFFIISFAVYLGVQYRNLKASEYVGLQLVEDGINPVFGQ